MRAPIQITTTTPSPRLDAATAWREIASRRITVVPAFDGKFWSASVEQYGDARHNRKRAIRSVSAMSDSPLGAVAALIVKLEVFNVEMSLFNEE